MKKLLFALLAMTTLATSQTFAEDKAGTASQKLGTGVSITTATTVKELLAQPDKYLGKEVMVEGKMTRVCQKAGCWTLVKDDSYPNPIVAKVPDGVIVFPKNGAGKRIAVQGKVAKMNAHVVSELGTSAQYGIAATGAVVEP